ncbi:MAG: metallopeptidase family protein [Chloroflexi bacterium]|jgi:predicted Zn-dependent protease with MMP-like domain|nr:metallopeptidase family protein [Chloroflexota bacterium]MBT5253040.1 metallopeptidase family protein [Chloroflexota bacterium]MBT5892604.1 metallopeptidase family protein [Chloroflexota bacterium]MBT7004451.1 metallopeptidase family protein [Chloroflexota bacterium]MBT7078057.1 metallopeptidase family protein [Chloroflexota bacterium]
MAIHVSKDAFEDLVRDAIMSLPGKFLMKMENVSIIIAGNATPAQMAENGLQSTDVLYGLYDGVPLTERGSYVPPLPDIITIFQNPIEHMSHTQEELENQIVITVKHEVAHYFGFSDSELDEMGLG